MSNNEDLNQAAGRYTPRLARFVSTTILPFIAAAAMAVPPPTGVAPVIVPAGGFAIDGNLLANTPAANVGDWLPGPGGTGGSVLDATGSPLNPATTFHFIDLYNSGSDNTFSGGKWTDNPNTWGWGLGKANSKTDINNVLFHIATDADGHSWVIIAADRLSASGASYIDFEFLQNTLVANANGTFTSTGPNGGRTTNDLVLSLAFTSGGSVADFFAYRWQSDGSGGFTYADVTTNLPSGRVFVAASPASVAVPYGAFGQTAYAANQFVEGAVDLTSLLGNFNPCLSIGVATIMVKTKDAPSSTATISDFITPIQYTLHVGPSAYAGPNQTNCTQGASTAFALQGQATPGLQPIASTTWSVVSGTATIDSPSSLATTAHVSSGNATLRLTAIQSNGCTETSDVVLTVAPIPTCSISGPTLVCPKSTMQFSAPAGMASYRWSITGNGSISGSTNVQTVTVNAGSSCGATFTLTLNTVGAIGNCGNTCTTDVLVNDTVAPVITSIPADVTVQCASAVPAANNNAVLATDNCSGVLSVSNNDAMIPGSCPNNFIIHRTYTVTDSCGNSSSLTQNITVSDTTAPVITSIPADVTVQCASAVPSANTAAVVATDNCGSTPVITSSDQTTAGACINKFVIKRTYTATDACGNSSSKVQTITVNDTTAPVITSIPADVTVQCANAVPAANTSAVVATDNCGGTPVITSSDQTTAGACINKFVIKRTFTATDACGNSSSQVQTITVNDTTAPVITSIPADLTVQCASAVPAANTTAVVAMDSCGGTPVITSSDQTTPGACINKFVIKRTYTATDACGNSSSQVQTITVNDSTPPVITSIPADVTVQCPSAVPTASVSAVVATDACGGTPVIGSADQTIAGACVNKFVVKRTYTATDLCGNSSSRIQTITVNDNTGPVITSIPADVTVQCAGAVPSANTSAVIATDNCGGTPVITSSDQTTAGSCVNKFVIKRAYMATDICGNTSTQIQTITVNDSSAPVVTSIPADVNVQCAGDIPAANNAAVVATDSCGGTPVISHSDVTNNLTCANNFVLKRTYTATDACGNSTNRIQTITVQDTIAPIVSAPADVSIACTDSLNPSINKVLGTGTATDNCSGALSLSYSDQTIAGNCPGNYTIKRTWSAHDSCSNIGTALQTITVRDTNAPALTLPANVVLQCPGDTRTNVTGVPTVHGACGSVNVSYTDIVTNGCGLTKTVQRLWTAVDQCGNTTNGVQTITVVDTMAPTIACPTVSVQCAADVPPPYPNLATFIAAGGRASDACDGSPTFALMSDTGLVGSCPGKVTRVYRVTDACGNFSQCTQTITVQDTIAPVLTCPTNSIVECGTSLNPSNTGLATATDNCDTNVSITYSDALLGSQYNIKLYAADPNLNSGPFQPTYLKLGPGSLPCPDSAGQTGRAADPLRNAVAYGPTASTLDALTSMGSASLALGQIVPFEAVIQASGAPGPERGTVEFTASWSTYTTSNNRFGYDTNYMVYCAFVDVADPGEFDQYDNARVESFSSVVTSPGTIDEQIQGTFRVSGIDPGDQIVVEIWVVLMSSMPNQVGGTINTHLISAQAASIPPQPISIGNQTTSIGNLSKLSPLPPPQQQPPLGPVPPPPTTPPGCMVSVLNRTWTATDACGNRSSCVQQITVRDTTPPILNLPPNLVLACPADTSTTNTGVATAQDACGLAFVSYSDVVSNGCGGSRSVSRLWTAVDLCGNVTNALQTISVQNTPLVVAPPNLVLSFTADTRTNSTGVATATDACDSVTLSYSDSATIQPNGSQVITRTWKATDACGNSASAAQTITLNAPMGLTLPLQTDRSVTDLSTLVVTNTATNLNVPANPLVYQLINPPVGASIDANGIITWTPTLGQSPSTNIITTVVTTTVSTTYGTSTLSATNSFVVIVTGPYDGLNMLVDSDGDGLTNLVEYAVGTDPLNPTDANARIIIYITQDSGNHYLAMKFSRRTDAAALHLQYLPEVSADKLSWFSDASHVLGVSVTPLDSQSDWVTVRDTTPITPDQARFIRLHILSGVQESFSPIWIGSDSLVVGDNLTLFSKRMIRPILDAGIVASVSSSAITDTNASFVTGQFGTNGMPAYVEFNNGTMMDIANTTANNIALGSSTAGTASVGQAYRIRAHFTVASVFGTNNESGLVAGPNPAQADNVLVFIPETQRTLTLFYYSNPSFTSWQGWVRADTFSPDPDEVIYPEEGLMVRRIVSSNANVYLCGPIKTDATVVPVQPGYNLLGTLKSLSSVTLSNLNLYTADATTGLVGGLNPSVGDNLLVVQPNGSVTTYFYYYNPGVYQGWVNANGFSLSGGATIPAGSAFFINRQAPGAFTWTIPAE